MTRESTKAAHTSTPSILEPKLRTWPNVMDT